MKRAACAMLLFVGLVVACEPPIESAGPAMVGSLTVAPNKLIRLSVSDVPAGAAVTWMYDEAAIDAHEVGPTMVGTAPPGTYSIYALLISVNAGNVTVSKLKAVVVVQGSPPISKPPASPAPPTPAPPKRKRGFLAPAKAIGRLQMSGGRCTATVIGPQREDGRWDILTANHCMPRPGAAATFTLLDGRTMRVKRTAASKTGDLCWMRTVDPIDDLPYANLCQEIPPKGTPVWHAGYGTDRPGNKETGRVIGYNESSGQLNMYLSVSPGDSGGGIFRSDTDELISSVCCTSRLAAPGSMFGGSSVAAIKLRPN